MKNILCSHKMFPLKGASAQALGGEVVIVVGVVGEWHGHPSGSFKITAEDLVTIKENFEKQQSEIVVDYEHQTLYGEKAPAAGWISELMVEGEKLLAKVTWTSHAAEHIKAGEYKYVSPVYIFDSFDNKTNAYLGIKLHSVALTNTPFLDELGEVRANQNKNPKKEESMKHSDNPDVKEVEAALRAENEELKVQLAQSKVEAAIAANKITIEQKEWALRYCKQDGEGFEQFLSLQRAREVPKNHLYANKEAQGEGIDVVALATGNIK